MGLIYSSLEKREFHPNYRKTQRVPDTILCAVILIGIVMLFHTNLDIWQYSPTQILQNIGRRRMIRDSNIWPRNSNKSTLGTEIRKILPFRKRFWELSNDCRGPLWTEWDKLSRMDGARMQIWWRRETHALGAAAYGEKAWGSWKYTQIYSARVDHA